MTTVVKKVTGKKIFFELLPFINRVHTKEAPFLSKIVLKARIFILAQFVKYRRFILELSSFKILFYIGRIIGRFDWPFHDCPNLFTKRRKVQSVYYSHANETHFHKKGFALHSLVLKVRVFGTRKWLTTSYKVLSTCIAFVSLISPIGFLFFCCCCCGGCLSLQGGNVLHSVRVWSSLP